MKKSIKTFFILFTAIFSLNFLIASTTFATQSQGTNTTGSQGTAKEAEITDSTFTGRDGAACPDFLGLTSWDCGVDVHDETSLKTGIWQIVTNIAFDITVIAAYLVLGYVIYGGYLYIFSTGDPAKVAAGKKTLTHAFIGLAIVMSASLIMATIRFALLGANDDISNCATRSCIDANALVENTIQWFLNISGLVAVVFVIYGGISYTTSAGDPSKLQKAKQVILYALIGLAIVVLAKFITAFVSDMIRNAKSDSQTSYIQLNTKEPHES